MSSNGVGLFSSKFNKHQNRMQGREEKRREVKYPSTRHNSTAAEPQVIKHRSVTLSVESGIQRLRALLEERSPNS